MFMSPPLALFCTIKTQKRAPKLWKTSGLGSHTVPCEERKEPDRLEIWEFHPQRAPQVGFQGAGDSELGDVPGSSDSRPHPPQVPGLLLGRQGFLVEFRSNKARE